MTGAGMSPTTKILVQKAMIYGVRLDQDALADSARRLTDGEQLQDRTASTGDLEHVDFMGLLELVTACVCQSDSEAGGVLCAIQNLFEMDFTQCERIIDAMAVERRKWDAVYRELGENPMATFMRVEFSRTVSMCVNNSLRLYRHSNSSRHTVRTSRYRRYGSEKRPSGYLWKPLSLPTDSRPLDQLICLTSVA